MSKDEIIALDAHYEQGSMQGYKDALFQSLDNVGLIALESDLRDFICSLWQKGFVITPIGKTSKDQPITAELLELYGFVADEPGHWFLENEDDPTDLSIRVSQNLRYQNKWWIFIADNEGDETVDLMNFGHLLKVLEGKGITFTDEDDEE